MAPPSLPIGSFRSANSKGVGIGEGATGCFLNHVLVQFKLLFKDLVPLPRVWKSHINIRLHFKREPMCALSMAVWYSSLFSCCLKIPMFKQLKKGVDFDCLFSPLPSQDSSNDQQGQQEAKQKLVFIIYTSKLVFPSCIHNSALSIATFQRHRCLPCCWFSSQ
jgi:hypothetical protein